MNSRRTAAAANSGEEDTSSDSQDDEERKVPFPAEHQARMNKLAEAKRSLDSALTAAATFSMAETLLRSGRYVQASKQALTASELFTKASDRAKALRLSVRGLVRETERELFEDVPFFSLPAVVPAARAEATQQKLEEKLQDWRTSGHDRAAALVGLALADLKMLLGQQREALEAGERALKGFEDLHDQDGAAKAMQTMAKIRLRLGTDHHMQRALEDAEKAMSLHRKRGNTKRETVALLVLSKIHLRRKEYQDSYTFAGSAVKLAQANGHIEEEAVAMKDLALVLLSQGDPDRAAQFALDATELFHHRDDWLSEIAARHVLSGAYQADGFVNMAYESMSIALELARQLGDPHQIRAALDGITRILTKAEAPEAALECLVEEVKLASGSKGLRRELSALEQKATIELSLGKHEEALDTAEEAVDLSRAGRRRRDLARAFTLMATVSFAAERTEGARDALASACAVRKELGDAAGIAELWHIALTFYKARGEEAQIERAYKGMQAAYQDVGQSSKAADVLLERAAWALQARGLTQALELSREATRRFDSVNDWEGKARALLWPCACTDFLRNRPEEARNSATSARQLCLKVGDVEGEIRALTALSQVHLWNHAADSAVQASHEALALARKAGSKRCQAIALEVVADTHAELIFRDVDTGLHPPKSIVQDAIRVTHDASALFLLQANDEGRAAMLTQLSRLHLLINEGEDALQSALAALECAERLGEPGRQGYALLAVARAYEHTAGHTRDRKQALEQAKKRFETAKDDRGLAELRNVVRAARGKKPADVFEREFDRSWRRLYSEAPSPSVLEADRAGQRLTLTGFPESVGEHLKWYVWNTIWYAANTRYADFCEEHLRDMRLESAREDLQRKEKHCLAAKKAKGFHESFIRSLEEQARVAGVAAADAFMDGKLLTGEAVMALPPPIHAESSLWSCVVQSVRLAAAAVAEKLLETVSSSDEEQLDAVAPSRVFGLNGPPRAVARHVSALGCASHTEEGASSPLVDVNQLELAAEQRRKCLLEGRLPEECQAPGGEELVPAPGPPSTATSGDALAPAAGGGPTLAGVLQAVRYDWTEKELRAVQDKLAKIHIGSAEDLFRELRSKGVKGVNSSLKSAGQKCLKSETLAALHEYSESAAQSHAAGATREP